MRHTEDTDTLLRALRQARALDLDVLFASGLDVTFQRYADADDARPHVERVTLHPDNCGPLRDALIAALEAAVVRRREFLARQIADIDKHTGRTP